MRVFANLCVCTSCGDFINPKNTWILSFEGAHRGKVMCAYL